MKNILLTGAAGFIGAFAARELLAQGYNVIGLDNLNDYYDVRLKMSRLESLKDIDGFKFYELDIENSNELEKVFNESEVDGVINLAARAGVRYSMENPEVYMTTNAMGTLNLLQQMKKFDIKKMVLASTSSLYAGQQMPFVESLDVNTPISPYAASKKAAEVMAYSYHYLYGMDVSVVRYFTVYGPAGRPDMCIFRFIKWIDEGIPLTVYGDGSQSRDFTYVEDIAKGTVLALKDVGYEIINLGGGKNPISLNEVINMIEELLGKKATRDVKPFHKADLKETWANIEKANDLLSWEPTVGLREGVSKCVDWYLENKSLCSKIEV